MSITGYIILFWIAALSVVMTAAYVRWRIRSSVCEFCEQRDCICPPPCPHPETFRVRWTEDGWVRVCKVCGDWIYLGDDFDNRPADAEDYSK